MEQVFLCDSGFTISHCPGMSGSMLSLVPSMIHIVSHNMLSLGKSKRKSWEKGVGGIPLNPSCACPGGGAAFCCSCCF